jgi:hypothetical protein
MSKVLVLYDTKETHDDGCTRAVVMLISKKYNNEVKSNVEGSTNGTRIKVSTTWDNARYE